MFLRRLNGRAQTIPPSTSMRSLSTHMRSFFLRRWGLVVVVFGAFPHVRSRRRQCLSVENHMLYVGEMLARPSGCVFHMCFYTFSHRQEKRFANHVFPPADTVSSEVGQGFWAPPITCFHIRFSPRVGEIPRGPLSPPQLRSLLV